MRSRCTQKRRALIVFMTAFLALPHVLHGVNFDKTWAGSEWDADWTSTDDGGTGNCDSTDTFDYSTSNGNPSDNRTRLCVGRNDDSNRYLVWSGTWETLGVTAGFTVSTVQMLDIDTKFLTDTVCDDVVFGPLELRNSGGTLVATLWSGRTSTTEEASFTAEGSQTAQSVGSLTASNASIQIWLHGRNDTGNNAAATCTSIFDNLDIRISAESASRRVFFIGSAGGRKGGRS